MTLPAWDGTRWVPWQVAPGTIADALARDRRRTIVGRVVRWARALECDGPSWGTVVVVRQLATHGEVVHRSPFRGNPRAAERAALAATA